MILTVLYILSIYLFQGIFVKSFYSNSLHYLDEGMEQSVAIESMDNFKAEIQDEVAELLGLSQQTKPMKKHVSLQNAASKFLLEIYDSLQDEEERHVPDGQKRVSRSTLITEEDQTRIDEVNNIVTFSSKIRRRSNQNGPYEILTFNTNNVPQDLQLIRAELRIFQNSKKERKFKKARNVTVSLCRRNLDGSMELSSSMRTSTNFKGWLEANVTNILTNWLSEGYSASGNDLVVSTSLTEHRNEVLRDEDPYVVTPEDIGLTNVMESEEYQPFIIGYFNGPEHLNKIQHLRLKRDLKKKKRYSTEYHVDKQTEGVLGENFKIPKTCERMNFSIDFTDLQMQDWIIAPKKFEAYFCGGECNFPLGTKMNATNHAIVQTLMHLKQPNLPKPCCVPTVLSSISILHYLNEDSVNLSKYPNSVARSCGCH